MAVNIDYSPALDYYRVAEGWEASAQRILAQAASDIARDFKKRGARIPTEGLVRAALLEHEQELWRKMGQSIKASQLDAAVAAARAEAKFYDKYGVLSRTGISGKRLRESLEFQSRQTLDVALMRLHGMSYHPLSENVYRTSVLANGWLDRQVTIGLARGYGWKELADAVRSSINPNVRGGVAYAAKRLGRTEINNAFHATQILEAEKSPFIDMLDWVLSSSHPKPDPCDEIAENGPYTPRETPRKPHPQCMCHTRPYIPDLDEYIRTVGKNAAAGKYDDFLAAHGLPPLGD